MEYDVKLLQGLAVLTSEWKRYKESFFEYACLNGGERWQHSDFRNHMYFEYIKPEAPVTGRLFSLDDANVRLLMDYVRNELMWGTTERVVTAAKDNV